MTVYVDTSVLAAYYCPEPLSLVAERTLRSHSSPKISELTLVEFASAVSRKVQEKTLSHESATRVIAQFEAHVEDGYYEVLSVKARDYARPSLGWGSSMEHSERLMPCISP